MKARHSTLPLGLLALSSLAHAQTVSSIVPTDPTTSGLVRVTGANFGDGVGSKIVLAQATGSRDSARLLTTAHVARWTPDLIEFYVPENTALQPSSIYISSAAGKAYLGNIVVRGRDGLTGRFRWRFRAADQYISTRPAIGPDGTVYAIGNFGHLYALSPNGGLKWVWSGGADGTVDVGPDGTVYCAGGGGIQAFSPAGERLWVAPLKSTILAGPSVGPDGNIYAADNSRWNLDPTGAIVISPSGQTLWSGGVFYQRGGSHQTEVQFDQNRAFIWSEGDTTTGAVGGLRAMHLGGGLDWTNGNIVGFQSSSYANGGVVAHGTSTTQKMNTNGNVLWAFDLWSIGGSQPHGDLVSSPSGGVYFFTKNTRLNALNANGSLRFSNTIGGIVGQLTRNPNDSTLLIQRATNFGQPNRLEAYSAANGSFLWASDFLPIENGMAIGVYNRMKYSPDGSTVFFGTVGPYTSQFVAHCYIYAMNAL